jgi:maleylpyruvate isomerase
MLGEAPYLLHGYFRSGASYRVRIALNLKALDYADCFHHLRRKEHLAPDYLALNPQGLLPAFEIRGDVLTQSLAICEYLDEIAPDPALLPSDPVARAQVRAFAMAIACDIHPVQNLKILDRLRELGVDESAVTDWARQAIEEGLDALEKLLPTGIATFCFGESPTLADICLVPQLVNARRFGADMRWERLLAIERNCLELSAFAKAAPEAQPDAE